MRALPLFLPFLLLAVGGCDLIVEPDRAIVFEGVAVDVATGRPVPGISVQLRIIGLSFGGHQALDSDITGPDGRFRVQRGSSFRDRDYFVSVVDPQLYDEDSPGYWNFTLNGRRQVPISSGDRVTMRVRMGWIER